MVTRNASHGKHTRLGAALVALAAITTFSVLPSAVSAQSISSPPEDLPLAAAPVDTAPHVDIPSAAPAATPVPIEMPTVVSGVDKVLEVALAQQGKPYKWAADGPSSFDCSGLVMYAYAAIGRALPHSSRSLHAMTDRITEAQLVPGDLVFGGSPVHHVGIYVGDGQMVNAPQTGDVVKVSSIHRSSGKVSFGRL